MSKVNPITPKEVAKYKKDIFPDSVIEAFNELIAKNFVDNEATIKQKDVIDLMVDKGLNTQEIFNEHYLDIEEIYRSAGWKVVYDKPAYNETYDATFTFSK